MEENISYRQALMELEQIQQVIESGEIELEHLTQLTQRAKELVNLCQEKLRQTEEILKKES